MTAVSSVLKKVGGSIIAKGRNMNKVSAAAFAIDTSTNLNNGDDLGTSVAKASVTGIMTASNPALFGTLTAASLATDAYWGIQQFNYHKKQWWNAQYAYNNTVGGNYIDTPRAMTMRQAAVQVIQGSKMNARSALGNEAKILNPLSQRRY